MNKVKTRALQTLDTATRSTAVALSVERLFCPPALRTFRPPATKVASSWQTTHLYRWTPQRAAHSRIPLISKLNEGGHDGKAKTAATGALVLPYVNALLVCLALSNTDDEEDAAVSVA